jgi:NADPH:quinone reductase-like Zn-dependent oxidoreductase
MQEELGMTQAPGGTMKAVCIYEYGGLDKLKYDDLPIPSIGPRDALIKVHATGVNAFDLMVREGRYKPNKGKFPHIFGEDISGTIAALGSDVTEPINVGQRVVVYAAVGCGYCEQCIQGQPNACAIDYQYFGAHLPGGYAQYVRVPAFNVVPLPDNISFEDGAAFVVTFLTSWHMLVTRANLRPGETVLIQAAGAGISIAAIQIAKLIGATVIATASTDAKLERARALGADEVINYHEKDFQAEVMRLTGKRGVDVVFEHVGGDVWDPSIRSLTRGGRLVTCGGTASYDVSMNVAHIFHKQLNIIGSNHGTKRELEVMMPLLRDGKLKPVIDSTFPLQDAARAHEHLEARRQFGRVVLLPPE